MSALDLTVLSDEKFPYLTDAYEFVNTKDVAKELENYGFVPVKTAIVKTRNPMMQPYAKHTVAFQREDAQANENGVIPQLHLVNSYDGSTSLRFEFGMLRLVCSNGLVMKDGNTEDYRMAHTNIHENVDAVVGLLQENFHHKQGLIQQLMLEKVNKDVAIELVKRAIQNRFNRQLDELDYEKFILPTRYEDSHKNAWCTYNVIQERIINGDKTITYRGNDRAVKDENGNIVDYKESYRTLAPLRDFDKNFEVNKKLFNDTLELVGVA